MDLSKNGKLLCDLRKIKGMTQKQIADELGIVPKKEHYISFVSYVRFDRVLTMKLYPEQDCAVGFPKMYGGKIYFYSTSTVCLNIR